MQVSDEERELVQEIIDDVLPSRPYGSEVRVFFDTDGKAIEIFYSELAEGGIALTAISTVEKEVAEKFGTVEAFKMGFDSAIGQISGQKMNWKYQQN